MPTWITKVIIIKCNVTIHYLTSKTPSFEGITYGLFTSANFQYNSRRFYDWKSQHVISRYILKLSMALDAYCYGKKLK